MLLLNLKYVGLLNIILKKGTVPPKGRDWLVTIFMKQEGHSEFRVPCLLFFSAYYFVDLPFVCFSQMFVFKYPTCQWRPLALCVSHSLLEPTLETKCYYTFLLMTWIKLKKPMLILLGCTKLRVANTVDGCIRRLNTCLNR